MKFYIDQHGCAKNQVDGEEIIARLEEAGHEEVLSPESAELIIVNSCGFVEDAKKESLGAVMAMKNAYPDKRILLAGCLAQRYAPELAAGLAEADGIVGNADLGAVLEAAEAAMLGAEKPVLVPKAGTEPRPVRRKRLMDFPGTAHVKITEGCSNNCSYCAIPLIRGGLLSRPVDDIVDECRDLLSRGIFELVLIGQDLGSYGKDRAGRSLLPELLSRLSALPGDFRVRTLYIHPDHFPADILELMRTDERLLPYFDIPFQHASDKILRAMNRKGSADIYLALLDRIRSALPQAVIRSTFLVGFPGETEEDFRILRDFQEKARIEWLGAFAYSREEGTRAYGLSGRIPNKVALARKQEVEKAQEAISHKALERFVGQELKVLVEEKLEGSEGDEDFSLARAWLQAPEVDGLTVLRGSFEPGTGLFASVLAVNGLDLEAAPTPTGEPEKTR